MLEAKKQSFRVGCYVVMSFPQPQPSRDHEILLSFLLNLHREMDNTSMKHIWNFGWKWVLAFCFHLFAIAGILISCYIQMKLYLYEYAFSLSLSRPKLTRWGWARPWMQLVKSCNASPFCPPRTSTTLSLFKTVSQGRDLVDGELNMATPLSNDD